MKSSTLFKITLTGVLLSFLLSAVSFLQAEKLSPQKLKLIEDFVQAQMMSDRVPGLAVAIMEGDKVWAKGWGYADVENKTLFTEKSCFRLASVTKPMTAAAILQLMEKDTLSLDDEVQKYVPYFPRKPYPVIIRHLLGHLAGISHYRSYDELHLRTPRDTREAINIFAAFDLVAEPGTAYNYSSYGYNLLGAVIEGASKMPYGKYMKQNIWEPAGMSSTIIDLPENLIANRVKGYRLIRGSLKNSEYVDMSSRFASGGTRSNVIDLINFIKSLRDGKIIAPSTVEMMFSPMVTRNKRYTDYGMGWMVRPVNGHLAIYHSGSQQETRTFLLFLPSENLAISFGCNLEGTNPSRYVFGLLRILLDEPINIGAYSDEPVDSAIISALETVFDHGLAYFERYKKPMTVDEKELQGAFSYFQNCTDREAITKDSKKAQEMINLGRHPASGEPFTKMGSFMAEFLSKRQNLELYNKKGAIAFFADYLKYSQESSSENKASLPAKLKGRILAWEKDWGKTLDDSIIKLFIFPATDTRRIEDLQKRFSGARVYPDLIPLMAEAITKLYFSNPERALEMARLGQQIYPDSALALSLVARAYLASGDFNRASEFYLQAIKARKHKGACLPASILAASLEFFENNRIDLSLELIKIGKSLYADEAKFFKTEADLYVEKALDEYRKAFELQPDYEEAWKKLKNLEELKRL